MFQLMALIGEQFEEGGEICGVVASVRQRQDKLALWTKTASNEAVQVFFYYLSIYQFAYHKHRQSCTNLYIDIG
jgi:Eukaryotic initiation factor 4E